MYVYIYIYSYTYVHIYIYIYIHTHIHISPGAAEPDMVYPPASRRRLSLPRFVDSTCPGNSLWTWDFHPLKPRFGSRHTLRGAVKRHLPVSDAWPWRVPIRIKIALEYGPYRVRAPDFYGNLREQTGENGFPRIPTGTLFCSYRSLQKPPGVYGIM